MYKAQAEKHRAVSFDTDENTQITRARQALVIFYWEIFMTKKILTYGITLFALTACAATGQQYVPAKASKGEAKVVVYRSPNGGPAPIDTGELYLQTA